ncbi:hypothetical protein DUNSADRAFT_15784 [Dunaliella salina]|uniref:Encoded protein n=1 Tax=Dunaliella salina TaxID=3046 RepID=A0ABQ7H1F5_DUNSA|nr:hypothetical protein DUNSADRAFT_15784 [Dunaliella salina]|eukprot:KAF5840689.1 hypothetical protein DUNSADRAFT_15784 [Dunaliella salina]
MPALKHAHGLCCTSAVSSSALQPLHPWLQPERAACAGHPHTANNNASKMQMLHMDSASLPHCVHGFSPTAMLHTWLHPDCAACATHPHTANGNASETQVMHTWIQPHRHIAFMGSARPLC